MSGEKIRRGQFYTTASPFTHPAFTEWLEQASATGLPFCEPFAGGNNLIAMFDEAWGETIPLDRWVAFDVAPNAVGGNRVPTVPIVGRDTIGFPVSGCVVITNPPYLAKNSATRKGLVAEVSLMGVRADLYEVALDVLLAGNGYVAAIIPESFITRGLHLGRLEWFISLNSRMFDDTEFPVGLALFTPNPTSVTVYVGDVRVGELGEIERGVAGLFGGRKDLRVVFNDPAGVLGLYAVDSTGANRVRFVRGESIVAEIKPTSRAITRISVYDDSGVPVITEDNVDGWVEGLNTLLDAYRELSGDVLLTSFKGLRKDGKYRRRLDWATAVKLIHATHE